MNSDSNKRPLTDVRLQQLHNKLKAMEELYTALAKNGQIHTTSVFHAVQDYRDMLDEIARLREGSAATK